ncbi:MAG: hydrogenase maturation protease [Spirochaetales bacterium]|nr:hydrogenase maturation protease [Spirochaetales bacterium]
MRYLVGLGNYFMTDDSIGLRMVEFILEEGLDKGFQAIEIPGNALNILSYLTDDTEKIVIVDAAQIEKNPGEYRFFTINEVRSEKETLRITTHEDDMVKVLLFAEKNGYTLPDICFMGIQPEIITMGDRLSSTLNEQFHEYVTAAIAELKKDRTL